MPTPLTGGCLCGAVRYTVAAPHAFEQNGGELSAPKIGNTCRVREVRETAIQIDCVGTALAGKIPGERDRYVEDKPQRRTSASSARIDFLGAFRRLLMSASRRAAEAASRRSRRVGAARIRNTPGATQVRSIFSGAFMQDIISITKLPCSRAACARLFRLRYQGVAG